MSTEAAFLISVRKDEKILLKRILKRGNVQLVLKIHININLESGGLNTL